MGINLMKVLDPVGSLVEVGAKMVGIPEPVINAAKVVGGVATANPMMVINGAAGLVGNAADLVAAKTEYHPGGGFGSQKTGYASSSAVDARELDKQQRCLETLRDHFPHFEAALGWPIPDGLIGRGDLLAIANSPSASAQMREAAQYLLAHPEFMAKLETAAAIGRPDGLIGLADIDSALRQLREQQPVERELMVKPGLNPRSGKTKTSSSDASSSGSSGKLDPNLPAYASAIETLLANWEVFDTAVGNRDGLLTRQNLEQMLRFPNASNVLKSAAKFLLDHPEYLNRLEMAAGIGGKDGVVGRKDVEVDLARVRKELSSSHLLDTPLRADRPPREGSVRSILDDPSLSLEEKIELILMLMTEGLDEAIGDTMAELANAQDRMAAIRDDRERATNGVDRASHEKEAAAQRSVEQLQLKLQKLLERRKQAFELMSTLSQKFNEMAKTAIQNMGRA